MSLCRGWLLQGLAARGSPATGGLNMYRLDLPGYLSGRLQITRAMHNRSLLFPGSGCYNHYSSTGSLGYSIRRFTTSTGDGEGEDEDEDEDEEYVNRVKQGPSELLDKFSIYDRFDVDNHPERREIVESILKQVDGASEETRVDPGKLRALERQLRRKDAWSRIDLSGLEEKLDKIKELDLSDLEEESDEESGAGVEKDPLLVELEALLEEDDTEVDYEELLDSMNSPAYEATTASEVDKMVAPGKPKNEAEERAYFNLYRRYYPDRGMDYNEAEEIEEEEEELVHDILKEESKKAREGTKFSDKPYLDSMENSQFWNSVGEMIMSSQTTDEFIKNVEIQLKENGRQDLLEEFYEAKQKDSDEFKKTERTIRNMIRDIKHTEDPLEAQEKLKDMKRYMRSVFDDPVISQVFDRPFGLPKEEVDEAESVRRQHEADFKDLDYDETEDYRAESDDEYGDVGIGENECTVVDLGASLPENPIKAREEEKKILQTHGEHYLSPAKFTHRVLIQTGRHIKLKRSGRVESVSALMVVGDGKGTGGMGYGKGKNFVSASSAAIKDAIKNSFTVHLFDGRTISHPTVEKYCRDRVHLWPLGPDSGVRASNLMSNVIRCFGVKDLRVKTYGRRNMHNTLKALVKGLKSSHSEKYMAEAFGKKVFNVHKIYRPQERRRAF